MKTRLTQLGWTLSLLFSLGFLVCFVWTFILTGDQRELHLSLLQLSYLKFSGLDAVSFISGLVQSFVWGWIVALVFLWLWKRFEKNPLTPQN